MILIGVIAEHTLAQQHSLTIVIRNVQTDMGSIMIGIYNESQSFPKEGRAYKDIRIKPELPVTRFQIELPEGVYAICLCHDVNNDRKCNTDLLGRPKEPFGFSNNLKPKFSAPGFTETSFSLKCNREVSITLID